MRKWIRSAPVVGLTLIAMVTLLAWATGRVITDRFAWSQWLLWIPTPAALAVTMITLAVAARPAGRAMRRRRVAIWLGVTVLIGAWFALFEHRLLRPTPAASGLKLVHWTRVAGEAGREPAFVEAIKSLEGDVLIVTNAGAIPRNNEELLGALAPGTTVHQVMHFGIFTALPIRQLRPLVATEGILVGLLEIDASDAFGRPLVLYLVDLPSDPRRPRHAVARRARTLLAEAAAPAPDVVLGDFNMTRGSAALRTMLPGLVHAFDRGGHGYGASFHRRFPLYHIDHVLVAPGVDCRRYDLVDAGLGRHRAQIAYLAERR